ncbi:pelargonidin 3-o-(6-caffeoylglucoside) 5-o-(6-o-malonylglucoside) 4'''-malonyltransferase [Phtheirospermum japonicum]|uniref:Pelargonidin 3-o-(6-caffeoylglucoside) 5-o-(6-o-malonylglucoside) 4'''-malonyltransferase n=1 Tax=Phtheirospermum japonicum TaxID=374723 RepID=A0A830BRR7_9LAMI|nr:pelargonidin 3-o-(6-caffeoylglucoside) 5-o-(6-o-malonylglucoside) 4'''-malonyltransferase [Phtheirospermum japonicum]
MKIEVQSRKLVKPCTPTPQHLRIYNISLLDELNPSMHVIRILYYHHNPPLNNNAKPLLQDSLAKDSLAKVLPLFHPLAGRYVKDTHVVDCNDEGAEFSEALVDFDLLHLTAGPNSTESEQLNNLLPLDIAADPADPMLAVQVNTFRCGGLAIGVCASHRIFDSGSLGIFLAAWADVASRGNGEFVLRAPDYFGSPSSLYFPSENVDPLDFGVSKTRDRSIVGKRFVFDKTAISRLRHRNGSIPARGPSRVMVVSAVVTQAILRADRAKNGGSKAALIGQAINVRERTVPPVPKQACGTWAALSYLECDPSERAGVESLVGKMREAAMRGVEDCGRILSDKEFGRWVMVDSYLEAAKKADRPDYKAIWITDFSKFGEYQLDFGFRKPVWVSLASVPLKDHIVLMNTKENDGIEAWVYLHESDMPFLERDEVLTSML